MRARLTPKSGRFFDKPTSRALEAYLNDKTKDLTRRFYKIALIVLNQSFGFGAKERLPHFVEEFTKLCDEHMHDPVFWEHVDIRLRQMGFEFEIENYNEKQEGR